MARTTDGKAGRLLAGPARVAGRLAQRPVSRPSPARGAALWGRIVRYLRDVRTELARVNWPSRKELIGSTIVVVVVLVVLALYLGLWDWIFTVVVRRYLIGPTGGP